LNLNYPHPVRRAPRLAITALFAVAGIALLVWQIQKVGIDDVRAGIASVGPGFLGILLLSLLRFTARAAAWRALLPDPVPLGRALAAVIAGDAVSKTPLSVLVSEPAKAVYLGGPAGAARALAALAAENFFYAVSIALYITAGTAAFLVVYDLPREIVLAGTAALGGMAVILAGAAWLAWQQPAVVSSALARLPTPRLAAWVSRIRDFELQAYGSVGGHRPRLARVALAETTFHALSFLEAWFTLWLLTGESLPLVAFVLDTFSRVVNIVFNFVPMRLGVDQYGSSELARAIGQPLALGLNLSLVRTLRQLVWMAVGLALLAKRGLGGQER
jgi:hypothetical protein